MSSSTWVHATCTDEFSFVQDARDVRTIPPARSFEYRLTSLLRSMTELKPTTVVHVKDVTQT